MRGPFVVAAAGAALAAALVRRDPHQQGSWGACPFLLLTGVPCPACGGLRATNDLLHGHLAQALSTNAYAVGTAVLLAVGFASWSLAAIRARTPSWSRNSSRIGYLWLAGLLAFGVLRLLPAVAWLQP